MGEREFQWSEILFSCLSFTSVDGECKNELVGFIHTKDTSDWRLEKEYSGNGSPAGISLHCAGQRFVSSGYSIPRDTSFHKKSVEKNTIQNRSAK